MTSSNESSSALLAICARHSPVTGEVPAHRPVTRSFDVFFDLCLNKRLSKHSWGWWYEKPSRSLWRHCNAVDRNASRYVGVNPANHVWWWIWLLVAGVHFSNEGDNSLPHKQGHTRANRQGVNHNVWCSVHQHSFTPQSEQIWKVRNMLVVNSPRQISGCLAL